MVEKTIGLLPWILSQLYHVGAHGIKELNLNLFQTELDIGMKQDIPLS